MDTDTRTETFAVRYDRRTADGLRNMPATLNMDAESAERYATHLRTDPKNINVRIGADSF